MNFFQILWKIYKQNITDNQYKMIMDSLMEIDKINNQYKSIMESLCENQERNKLVCLFNWLDTKLELTDNPCSCIKRSDLQKYVIIIILIKGIIKMLIL